MNTELRELIFHEVLTDLDGFGDWLYGHLQHKAAVKAYALKLGFYLLYGPADQIWAAPVADVFYVALTDSNQQVRLAALDEVLNRYHAHRAPDVEELAAELEARYTRTKG